MSPSMRDRNSPPCRHVLVQGRAQTQVHVIKRITQVFPFPKDPQNQIIDY